MSYLVPSLQRFYRHGNFSLHLSSILFEVISVISLIWVGLALLVLSGLQEVLPCICI